MLYDNKSDLILLLIIILIIFEELLKNLDLKN